ncbi:MAG: hypothetical protein ACI9UA_000733 [Pseudoalteromonas tetraodonis]
MKPLKTTSTELICQHFLQSHLLMKGVTMLGLGVVAFVAAGAWATQARVNTLCEAVDDLNDEISGFLGSGGCLAGIRGVEPIIATLKAGGADIDPRLGSTMQTAEQAATDEPRVVWDPQVQRLVMRIDGEPGARELNFCARAEITVAA